MYTTRNGEGSPSLSEKYFRAKYTAKWSVQIAGMLFQTGSKAFFQHSPVCDFLYLIIDKTELQ